MQNIKDYVTLADDIYEINEFREIYGGPVLDKAEILVNLNKYKVHKDHNKIYFGKDQVEDKSTAFASVNGNNIETYRIISPLSEAATEGLNCILKETETIYAFTGFNLTPNKTYYIYDKQGSQINFKVNKDFELERV